MNSSQSTPLSPPATPSLPDDGDNINLLKLLDVVLDARWLIAGFTLLGLLFGAANGYLSTPIYEANTLIQVEEGKGNNVLGDAGGSLFEVHSSVGAEIELLRSRLVVGQAVDNLQLDLSVTPKYLPLIGRWLSRRAVAPSNPGFFGLSGYVTGNEFLKVARFDVPPIFEGQRFSVVLTDQGYELRSPANELIARGVVGQSLEFKMDNQKGRLLVAESIGKAGSVFYLVRASHLGTTERLQSSLTIVEQGRQSGVIRSSIEGSDPARIARVLNEIGTLYVNQNVERKAAEAQKSLGFLDIQLPQLRARLEDSEGKFNKFRNQKGIFDLGAEAKQAVDKGVQLQTSLFELQQKRKELEARFTDQHPSVQILKAQIVSIQNEMGGLEAKAKTFPNVEQDLLRLTRDVKVNTEIYTSLLNSYQQLRLVKEGKVGNVRVVDVAAVSETPVKPDRLQVFAFAGILGLAAGLALAFLRNSLRPGLKDPAEIEQRTGLPVFASLPHSTAQATLAGYVKNKAAGNHVLATVAPHDPAVESLRSLRTALQFAMLDARNNMVLITGPTPGIGKSFTSVNFAAVLGAADKKVLLIDGDLRKGYLNQYFGLKRGQGLSEVLSGTVGFEAVLHRQVVPNVDFLSTGTLPLNPAELLMSPTLNSVVQQLARLYDLIVIDTAPVLAASDTAIVARLAGFVFLVARAEVTSLGELHESVKRLAHTGVRAEGVIFNDLNISKRRYGYGLGYSYGGYRYTNYKY